MNNLTLHFEPEYRVKYLEHNGSWRVDTWEEIRNSRGVRIIGYNNDKFKNYIIIDIDHEHIDIYKHIEIPKPNIIVKNKNGIGAHYLYFLDNPIYCDGNKELKKWQIRKLRTWKKVFNKFTEYLVGDTSFNGEMGKNIYCSYFDTEVLHDKSYSLNYLENFCKYEPKKTSSYPIIKTKKKQLSTYDYTVNMSELKGIEEGSRNVTLFNTLKLFAYREYVKTGHKGGSDFDERVKEQGLKINSAFVVPLPEKEAINTVNSVKRYCYKKGKKIFYKEFRKERGIMNLPDTMTIREKQQEGAKYTSVKKVTKTRLKIELTIRDMKRKGLSVSLKGIAKASQISYNTVKKNRDLIEKEGGYQLGVIYQESEEALVKKNRDLIEKEGGYQLGVIYQESEESLKERKDKQRIVPSFFFNEAPTWVGATEIENGMLMSSNSQSKSPLVLRINEVKKKNRNNGVKNKSESPGEFSVKGHLSEDVRNLFSDFLNSG